MALETAVIIAGGKGARLEEKTEDLPKPMIPVGGIPLIERVIRWLRKNEVKKLVIGVAYKKEKIMEYLRGGEDLGVNITYTCHDADGGTEDAFKTAIEQSGIKDENFYAMNGDQITDLQLEGLTNAHLKNKAIATLVTVRLRTNFGIIDVDMQNRIAKIHEKWSIPNILMNSGIYVFNQGIKNYLQGGNIEENTFRKLAQEGKIYSFYYDGEWMTVNDKKELKKAEDFLRRYDSLKH
ncbi:nucleotidyltransferase family protein [Candidatus Pacearchaeota archaeon]|nr:nucleotidyltransferase family protein [Candidatus Pacearchaeota archaeon]